MTKVVYLLHLLVCLSLISATIQPRRLSPPPAASPTNCSDELVAYSACLPFISMHPNNRSRLPSKECCHAIVSSIRSQTTICLCYFIQQPLILGFPLNSTRLMSLTKYCSRPIDYLRSWSKLSLKSLCDKQPVLPPLKTIKGPDGQVHWAPGGEDHVGSPEHKSGPGNLSPPSTYPRPTNNKTKPTHPVQESVPAPAPAPAPAPDNSIRKPKPVPTSSSTNAPKKSGPVPTSGDDSCDHEPGNSSAPNFRRNPGELLSSMLTCGCQWILQFIILAIILSSCL